MNVRITGYDQTVDRADPLGLHVTYDVDSDRPIVALMFWLDDGATPLELSFLAKKGTDGRYVRGCNVKPTITGRFHFHVRLMDDEGHVGEAVSETPVTVTEGGAIEDGETTFPFPALLRRFEARFPVPQTPGGGDDHEERCRQWSIQFAEQVAFEHGQEYGVKRAGPGRPISKDSLARQVSRSVIWSWDLLIGTGTGTPVVAEHPEWHDISDQLFEPVTPVNHLG
jgi:hypothetical protein